MNLVSLFFRVRDEFRLTIHAAETLYESSIAFGNRFSNTVNIILDKSFNKKNLSDKQWKQNKEELREKNWSAVYRWDEYIMQQRQQHMVWKPLNPSDLHQTDCSQLKLKIEELNIAKGMLATRWRGEWGHLVGENYSADKWVGFRWPRLDIRTFSPQLLHFSNICEKK